jgi:hypothetical protein
LAQFPESLVQLSSQFPEATFNAARASDQDMVSPFDAGVGEDFPSQCPETTLHAVAYHRSADLPGDCDSEPNGGIRVPALADEQDEAGHGRSAAFVRRQEICAAAKRD